MRTAQQLREEIQDLRDELDSIVAISEREDRDLSDDENTRVFAITDTEIPKLNKHLKSTLQIEREKLARSTARFEAEIDAKQSRELIDASGDNRWRDVRVPAKAKAHPRLTAYEGPDGQRDAYIAGNVILANIYGSPGAIDFCRNHNLPVQGNMLTTDNSTGGFVVPAEMSAAIIRLRESRGIAPQFCNRIPMGSDIITVPRLLADCTAYWVGEGSEITSSDVTLGSVELMARKLACLTKVSSELDEDAAVEIGDMITTSMAYDMADEIDKALFLGDGTSTYGGVYGLVNAIHANAIQGAASGNDGALELDLADFEATIGKLPDYPGMQPRWFMSKPVFWASCARLADAAGGNTNVTLGNGPSETQFLGYPVTWVQVMPQTTGTAASTILAYFGDLRLAATYGTRRSMRTEVSLDRYFENDLIGIKATERVAINFHERGADIRQRPIVALKSAA